jgi:hypothetical protein
MSGGGMPSRTEACAMSRQGIESSESNAALDLLADVRRTAGLAPPAPGPLENGAAMPYMRASFRNSAISGVQHAAVTASICADDGRANALVRRGSALGLTERLT